MLVVLVPAVLPNQCLACQIPLQFFNIVLFAVRNELEPSLSNQRSKPIALLFVQFYINWLPHKNGNILRRNYPSISRREVADLRILSISLVESEYMDLSLMLRRQFIIAR